MIPVHLLIHLVMQSASAKVSACEVKRVTCMACGGEYIYQLRRKATGSSQSVRFMPRGGVQMAAEADAKRKLQKLLKDGVDPVPCPRCGVLQDFMIAAVRRRRLRWIIGIFGVLGMAVALLWLRIGLMVGAGVDPFTEWATVLLAAGLVVSLPWATIGDMNARAHRRTREVLGRRCRAMPAEEFDAMLASPEPSSVEP